MLRQLQYLTFLQGNEQFAVALLHVKEIIEYTHVPMVPDFIRGVINLRGRLLPVVDLQARLGNGRSQVTRRTCIIIVEIAVDDTRRAVGIVVDAVSTVLDIADSDIEPRHPIPPRWGATSFIGGMGRVADKLIIILAVDQLLSLHETATPPACVKSSFGSVTARQG